MSLRTGDSTGCTVKSEQKAQALKLKAELLTGATHKPLTEDPNITAALKAVGHQSTPPTSLTDRLAALKQRA